MSLLKEVLDLFHKGAIKFLRIVTLVNRDYPYGDYHTDTTKATKQTYLVGDKNMVGKGDQHKNFVSKSLLIMATTNTYVIFNHVGNVVEQLLANNWYEFKRNIYRVTYYYVTSEGTIYIHPEGVLPQEQRGAE